MHKLAGDFILSSTSFVLFLLLIAEEYFELSPVLKIPMYLISLVNPIGVIYSYYMNFNICDNMFKILYNYKNTFKKRYLFYKYSSKFFVGGAFLFSFLFNKGLDTYQGHSLAFYSVYFISIFYIICTLLLIATLYRLFQVFAQKSRTYKIMNTAMIESNRSETVQSFLTHQIIYVIIFLVTYTPNNLIQLAKTLDIKNTFTSSYNWSTYAVLGSLFITIVTKFTEPYMIKHYIQRYEVQTSDVYVPL